MIMNDKSANEKTGLALYITLTTDNFQEEVIESPLPVMVVFIANWYGSYHIVANILAELASEFKVKIKFCELDAIAFNNITEEYKITELPTFLFFNDGTLIDKAVGMVPRKDLVEKLNGLVHAA
jgi:thioredoxin 1